MKGFAVGSRLEARLRVSRHITRGKPSLPVRFARPGGNKIFPIRGEVWRVQFVETKGHSRAHFVKIILYLMYDTGNMDNCVVVREAQEIDNLSD